MRKQHSFLFAPGVWEGEGVMGLSVSPEKIKFYTRWSVEEEKEGVIVCQQVVKVEDVGQETVNSYELFALKDDQFEIRLNNIFIAKPVLGRGKIEKSHIKWSFSEKGVIEGEENYTLSKDGSYQFESEWHSSELTSYQNVISGKIWESQSLVLKNEG